MLRRVSPHTLIVITLTALGAAETEAIAQTLVTLEGSFPSGGEFSIHPPNACGFPSPGANVWFLPDFASPCGTILTFTPPATGLLGDSAVDKIRDIQYMTDGLQITGYQDKVAVIQLAVAPGVLLPGAITGMGYDSENDRMFLTDGASMVGIAAPALGCSTATVVVPLCALPTSGGIVTDIDWDSWSDSLWMCEDNGIVTNVTAAGAVGPAGSIIPTSCGLGPLTGIAFDTCQGTLFVTDGAQMEHVDTTGVAAAPTFYAPNGACNTPPPPGPPSLLSGLAFSPRPQKLGEGCANVGSVPEIGFVGSFSTSPNPNFGITVHNAYPGGVGVLLLGLGAACPGFLWGSCELYPVPFFLALPTTIDGNGDAAHALPIPSLAPGGGIGVTVVAQWIVQPPVVGRQASEGLSFTLSTL